MQQFCHLNGQLVLASEAAISVSDLAILRGYGVFDFMQVREGIPLFFDLYLERFTHSATALDLSLPAPLPQLKAWALELIEANGYALAGLKFILTGGVSPDGFSTGIMPNLIIYNQPFPHLRPDDFKQGVKLMLHEYLREIPEAKTINYIVPIRLQKHWKAGGAFDILYHKNGYISESSRSNFFIVTQEGRVVTPKDEILNGVTHRKVIEVAQAQGFIVEERPLALTELATAAEAFMTSSTKGVLGVVQVEGQIIGTGQVGPITHQLAEGFEVCSQAYVQAQKQAFRNPAS